MYWLAVIAVSWLVLLIRGASYSKCLDRYNDAAKKHNLIGKLASIEVLEDTSYSLLVRYKCPEDYALVGEWKIYSKNTFLIHCSAGIDFKRYNVWPICRGPYENVTCTNEYHTWNETFGKPWLKPTLNLEHAHYLPVQYKYKYNYQLHFHCPKDMIIHRTRGLSVMTTKCKKDGGWTKEWPLCKGDTCPTFDLENGKILSEPKKFEVGVTLHIRCDPQYFLWGSNDWRAVGTITCLSSLSWSVSNFGCVTYGQFKRTCKREGKELQIVHDRFEGMILKCFSRVMAARASPKRFKTELATAVGIPLCFLSTLIIVMIMYVRRRRTQNISSNTPAVVICDRRQELVHLILPTYQEAIDSKPTTPPPTFDETFGIGEYGDQNNRDSPPTYDNQRSDDNNNRNDNQSIGSAPPSYATYSVADEQEDSDNPVRV